MMKTICACIVLICCFSCKGKDDRDHLIFKNSVSEIEGSMLFIDSLLSNFPVQKNPDKIQSYYYETMNGDSTLFINADNVGDIHNITIKTIAKDLNMTEDKSAKFRRASLTLLRNNISHCLRDYCGWVYVYKYSNDRGAFRPVIYESDTIRTQFMVDSCEYEIIDKKGGVILFKVREPPVPLPRTFPDTLSEVEE